MSFNAPTTYSTRPAPPSHREWVPAPYQIRAAKHLLTRLVGGLALDPGLGKTACTLAAFTTLQQSGHARTMLVIAPLRVCRHVWRQEGQKWSQFRHLRFAFLHGGKKEDHLRAGLDGAADIFLINPEGVRWLCNLFFGRRLPFDVVAIDELTRFKNAQSDRFKALAPRIAGVPRHWGLTGSLAPNGYMDLFGQQLILDGGAALGRYITHYRDRYFQVGYDGFTYDLLPGSAEQISAKLAPYWLQMTAEDYISLPPLVTLTRELDLEPAERKLYTRMKNDMLAELPGGVITAANQAACYAKLAQMANGAVYRVDRSVEHLHDVKLDALDEIVEELSGAPLLVGFEFQHDLSRLKEWHQKRFGKPLPYLGDGQTEKAEDEVIRRWNAGELPVLAAHPASAGHGLNMQEASAAHLAWFGIPWDFELYDQFIRRIRRRGNHAQRILMTLLVVKGTIDELKLEALRGKDMTQQALFAALNRIAAEGDAPKEKDMVAKLSTRGAAPAGGNGWGQGAPAQAAEPAPANTGWSGSPAQQNASPAAQQGAWAGDQRQAIQDVIQPREDVRAAFTGGVQEAAGAIAQSDYGPTAAAQSAVGTGWGQQTAMQTQQPAQTEARATNGTQAGGWGSSGAQTAVAEPPFEGGKPAQEPAAEPAKRSRIRKAAEPVPDQAAPSGPDIDQLGVLIRKDVLIEVMKSSPDAEVGDIIDITAELVSYILTGEKPAQT